MTSPNSHPLEIENRVRAWRTRRGWSQEELAERSGLSRSGISAIEAGRLVPSAAAALALASAFEARVEDLFSLTSGPTTRSAEWAWAPRHDPVRYWLAESHGRVWRYPAETTLAGTVAHDGVARDGVFEDAAPSAVDPRSTLVMACCDPAAGLLAAELQRHSGSRLLALPRSSGTALDLLRQGLVHAAGVHLSRSDEGVGNDVAVRERLGEGYGLLRVARWEEGIVLPPGRNPGSIGAVLKSDLRWVGRDAGSGARQCLDELLQGRQAPERVAFDHRGVAEAVRGGWADAGVCLRLVGEETGLDFLGVRFEDYDLCYPESLADDPRIRALIEVVRGRAYRRSLAALPGYDCASTGETPS